jgi:hypothetical protein
MIDGGVEPAKVLIWLLSMPNSAVTVSLSVIGRPRTTWPAPLVVEYDAVLKLELSNSRHHML